MYLLDTNVVSELRRFQPHGAVVAWLNSVSGANLRICAVTLGEIQRGVELTRVGDPAKAREIEVWADKLENTFAVIAIDAAIYRRHARLMRGRSDAIYEDALVAAAAMVHDCVVVTRNIVDFEGFGVPVFDPIAFPAR